MREQIPWGDIIGQVVGGVIAALAVTAASYIWRRPQAHSPQAVLAMYTASLILLIIAAFVIFRRLVRQSYEEHRRLTPLPFFLQLLIWGLFFAFPLLWQRSLVNRISGCSQRRSATRRYPIVM